MADVNPARKVKTTPFRMSFPNVLKPRKNDEGTERFELSMLFPPGTDHKPLMAAMEAAMVDKYGTDKAKWPKLKRGPKDVIRDFGEYNSNADKALPGDWTGWTMVRANANVDHPPAVVGPTKGADGKFPVIVDQREVYGGRWGRATIDAFVYDRKDGRGVTFGLANVQLLKHDTKFGSAVSDPNKDFDNASEEWAGGADDFDKPEGDAASGW